MTTANEVAKYIIKSLPVDNLKLQKLLYYSQGVHLVLYNKTPLFEDEIEAWDYGPVVPSVYHEYKKYGFDIIPSTDEDTNLSMEEMSTINQVLQYFGEMSGVALLNQTHYESPWKDAYKNRKSDNIITKESIYNYLKNSLSFSDGE